MPENSEAALGEARNQSLGSVVNRQPKTTSNKLYRLRTPKAASDHSRLEAEWRV